MLQGVEAIGYCLDRIAQIQAVVGEDDVSIFSESNNLGGGRARVDANDDALLAFG